MRRAAQIAGLLGLGLPLFGCGSGAERSLDGSADGPAIEAARSDHRPDPVDAPPADVPAADAPSPDVPAADAPSPDVSAADVSDAPSSNDPKSVDVADAGDGGDASGSFCAGCSMVTLPIFGENLVYHPARRRLYVTVGSSFAGAPPKEHADSLVVVDPATATVLSSTPLGRSPGPLALSDDGSTLWVAINGEQAVRKVTTADPPVAGPLRPLPAPLPPDVRVETRSIAVLPGSPRSVAVATYSTYSEAVTILDDGVPRPIRATTPAAQRLTNGPPGYLFGVNRHTELVVMKVASDGVTQERFRGLLGQYVNKLIYTGSQLFATQGEVIDVRNPHQPARDGVFAFSGSIDVATPTRWLMLSNSNSLLPAQLRILDPRSFTQVTAVTLPPEVHQSISLPRDLAYLGGDAVAFLAQKADNRMYLFLVRAPAIAP